jgi:hypothetical protein
MNPDETAAAEVLKQSYMVRDSLQARVSQLVQRLSAFSRSPPEESIEGQAVPVRVFPEYFAELRSNLWTMEKDIASLEDLTRRLEL